MKVTIFTADSNGGFPVPAVKGGAVSTLIESLAKENNDKRLCDMTIVSLYNERAKEIAKNKYPNVHFEYIKVPALIKVLDKITFFVISNFFKNKKSISYKSLFSLLFYIVKSSALLKNSNNEKIILENNIPLAMIIKLSKYTGEYYYHIHNIPRINAKCKNVFNNCTGYLCVSKYVGIQIESKNNPIGPILENKIQILYNAIDTNKFKVLDNLDDIKRQISRKYKFDINDRIILYTGRISPEKGIDKLIDALSYLDNKHKFVLLIAGSVSYGDKTVKNDYVKKVIDKAKHYGKKIKFTGYIDQNDLPKMYNAADVAVLPSLWDEPAGLTMLEALSCGTPVITTQSGGIPEYVMDDAIVIKRDKMLAKNIAFNINKILANPSIYRKKGIQRIRNNFSEDNYLERFIKSVQDKNNA